MKLIFKKDKDSQISVLQDIDGQEKEFSYVEMMNTLIKSKKMEEPEISDDFTKDETESINRMVKIINEKISSTDAADTNASR